MNIPEQVRLCPRRSSSSPTHLLAIHSHFGISETLPFCSEISISMNGEPQPPHAIKVDHISGNLRKEFASIRNSSLGPQVPTCTPVYIFQRDNYNLAPFRTGGAWQLSAATIF
jgi:hypothetical protein